MTVGPPRPEWTLAIVPESGVGFSSPQVSAMALDLRNRVVEGVTIIDVSGRIVFGDDTDQLRASVRQFLSNNAPKVILNLAEVTYVDSGGIGCLVGLFTTARAAGGDLKVTCPNERVRHVLEITRLLPVLGVFHTETEAVSSFQQRATA